MPHPRFYDTTSAGGFLLVGKVPEKNPFESVFTVGEQVDTFSSIADLKEKIRHWLKHPTEGRAVAERADVHIHIPGQNVDHLDSLNVSVAAGVLLSAFYNLPYPG